MGTNFSFRGRVFVRMGNVGRGLAAMVSGSLVGQLILILATPFLSRIYPPESYGVFSVILAIAAIVGPAATLKLETALLLPSDDDSARRLLRLGLFSSIVISVLAGFAIWIVEVVGWNDSFEGVSLAPIWVGALVFATGSFSLLTQAAMRGRHYSTVAKRSITQSAGTVIGQFILALVTNGPGGLLGGFLAGRFVGYVPMFAVSKNLFGAPRSGSYRSILRRYWRFPALFTASGLLNTAGSQLPLIMISVLYGVANAGELGMAQRLVFIPVTLIGASMSEVFGAEVTRLRRDSRAGGKRMYLKTSAGMALIAAVVVAVLLFLAPWALPFILGANWTSTGFFAQAMAVSVGFGLIASPVSKVFMVYERAIASLIVDVSRIGLFTIALFLIIAIQPSTVEAVWWIYGAQSVNYLITWLYGLQIVSKGEPKGVMA